MKLALALCVLLVSLSAAAAQQAPQLDFVSEYARELAANEGYRALGEKELAESTNGSTEHFQTMIRASTRTVLELSTQVRMMQGMHLSGQLEQLPGMVASVYQEKIRVHQRLIQIASHFAAGPQPDIDYGGLVAEAPTLTAKLEYIDRTLFEATPAIFGALIDETPDANGHMSRLIVTKAQKDELIKKLERGFGEKLDQEKPPNYIVGSAAILRYYLREKGYRCSDEPD